jgi:putative transposase
MPRGFLRAEGIDIGHENAPTMMRRMEGEGVYRRPNTSKPVPG